MEKATVPKFGSFKPRTPATKSIADQDTKSIEPERRHRREIEGRSRPGRHGHDHNQHHRHHHRSDRQGSIDDHRRRHHQKEHQTVPLTTQDEFEESDLFIVDRRGDSKNVEYGSLHRYAVPAYRRTGYGHVIGLPVASKIDKDQSSEREAILTSSHRKGQQKPPRLLTSKQGKVSERHLRFVMCNSNGPADSAESDYIKLEHSRKRKRGSDSSLQAVQSVDYRSIEGKAKTTNQPADEDLTFASDSEEGDVDDAVDLRIRQTSAMLSKNAKTNPTDVDSWLKLVEHQRELVLSGQKDGLLSSSQRRTLADLRLSILGEAASHIAGGNAGRERLLSTMLEEGSRVWSTEKLSTRWKDALTECSSSTMLWTKYLNYIQDNYAGFRFEICKSAYISCLGILARSYEGAKGDAKTAIGRVQTYVLIRLTHFLRDAGYNELAFAVYQALLEYHFFMPPDLRGASLEDRLVALEDFWESEAPRVGEDSARGWAQYAQSQDPTNRALQHLSSTTAQYDQPFTRFIKAEEQFADEFVIPASTDHDDAMRDPYRCVMFADIRDIVEHMCEGTMGLGLLNAFLHYIGLPWLPLQEGEEYSADFAEDSHIWRYAGHPARDQRFKELGQSSLPVQSQQESTNTLFGTAFDAFCLANSARDTGDDLVRHLDRLVGSVCGALPSHEGLAEYYLAFKLKLLPAEAPKCAKRLLKRLPSSLRLYNAYALVVARLESVEKALQVWTTAASMSARLSEYAQHDIVHLWHSRLLSQVGNARESGALLNLLADLGSNAATSETNDAGRADSQLRRLKVTRHLEEGFDRMRLAGRFASAAAYADIQAWLCYLSNANDIYETLEVYSKYATRLQHNDDLNILELLFQSKVTLLRSHVERRRPFRPATLRSDLERSLKLFPNNTIIMQLYIVITAKERLRSLLQDHKPLTKPLTVVQWSSRLFEEFCRAGVESLGSIPNTIRATITKALLRPDTGVDHSPALWGMWLDFEYDLARRERESMHKVKQVFLDGLRFLPWHKGWAIRGLSYLYDGTLTEHEIRQIHETMVERGLRLRVDLDDFV